MAQRPEIPALTGLRGIAAMMVALNHYGAVAPFVWANAPAWLVTLCGAPAYGMTLFFTLSGFVITYNYFDFPWGEAPARTAAQFAWLRFSRLYPLLLLFLVLQTDWTNFDLWTAVHYLSIESWLPFKFGNALPSSGRFNLSWSISTEIGLYVLFVAAVITGATVWARRCARLILIAFTVIMGTVVLSAVLSERVEQTIGGAFWMPLEPMTQQERKIWLLYESPFYRALEFGIGALAGWIVLRRAHWLQHPIFWWLPVLATIALLVFHWRWFLGGPWVDGFKLQPISSFLFACIMVTAHQDNPIARFCSLRALVFLGAISYSLYLFHARAMGFAGIFPGTEAFSWGGFALYLARLALTLLVTIAIATGLYYVVEVPARRALRALLRLRRSVQMQPSPALDAALRADRRPSC